MYVYIEGRALAQHYGCEFIETSAKQRIRIDETFYGIVREIRRLNEEKKKQHYTSNKNNNNTDYEDVGCCHSQCIIL